MTKNVFVVILLSLLSGCFDVGKDCKILKVEKILAVELGENSAISYQHLVLLEGFDKRCLDSNAVLKVARQYISETSVDTPIHGIRFFNSLKNFDSGETLSQPKSFFKNSLVSIWFSENTKQPELFIFYDRQGSSKYEGTRWQP